MVDRQNVTSVLGRGNWNSASHFSAAFDSFCVLGSWRAQPLLTMASSESISNMSEWLRWAPWCQSCPEGTVGFWFDAPAGKGRKDTFWHAFWLRFWLPLTSWSRGEMARWRPWVSQKKRTEWGWSSWSSLEEAGNSIQIPCFSDFLFSTVSSKLSVFSLAIFWERNS